MLPFGVGAIAGLSLRLSPIGHQVQDAVDTAVKEIVPIALAFVGQVFNGKNGVDDDDDDDDSGNGGTAAIGNTSGNNDQPSQRRQEESSSSSSSSGIESYEENFWKDL